MSEKEINELIHTGELALPKVPDEVMKAAEAHAEARIAELSEEKAKRKKRLIRLAVMLLLTVLVLIFTTIAWFTMSKEVSGTGAKMASDETLFTIMPVQSYVEGIYDDSTKDTYVRNMLLSGASKAPDVMTWTISNDVLTVDPDTENQVVVKGKNFGNGPAEGYSGGISPGSSGELQFIISPKGTVRADFTFCLYGYSVDYDEQGDEDLSTIDLIDSESTDDMKIGNTLLNGHILLFENYNPITKKYSGLIASNAQLKRILSKTYSSDTTVSIHWVWVETLAELILDDSNDLQKKNLRGKKSICSDQSEVIGLFKNNPSWFLFDPEIPTRTWTEFTSETSDADVAAFINNNYTLYSSYYNEADQCIGTNVAYLLLDMTSSGSAVSTP